MIKELTQFEKNEIYIPGFKVNSDGIQLCQMLDCQNRLLLYSTPR